MEKLVIIPNIADKKLGFAGVVAAGEQVEVTLEGFVDTLDDEEATTNGLVLEVYCGDKRIAEFPHADGDAWTESGDDITCTLDLDSDLARELCVGPKTRCLFVLGDKGSGTRRLWGVDDHYIKGWPGLNSEIEPYSMRDIPGLLEAWGLRLDAVEEDVDAIDASLDGHLADTTRHISGTERSTWNSKASAADLTAHTTNLSNPHQVTKAQVGLGNVDNTSDADKPVSAAMQRALDGRAASSHSHAQSDITGLGAALQGLGDSIAATNTAVAAKVEQSEYDSHMSDVSQDIIALQTRATAAEGGIATNAADIRLLDARFVDGATYDSTAKKILLKNDTTTIAEIDATDFIKDGMVSSVEIEDGKLVITFNTDAGLEPIEIPLTDIFDPANYYDKTAADGKFVAKEAGKGLSTEDYTTAEKTKLGGIAAGAQVNVIETVKVNGTALTPQDKAVNIPVPTLDNTVTRTSANGVKSSGIWAAIWGALTALPAGFTSLYDWCVAKLRDKRDLNVYGYGNPVVTFADGFTVGYGEDEMEQKYTAPSGGETVAFIGPVPSSNPNVSNYKFYYPSSLGNLDSFNPDGYSVWCLVCPDGGTIPSYMMYRTGPYYNIGLFDSETPTLTLDLGEATGDAPVMTRTFGATGDTLAKVSQLAGKADAADLLTKLDSTSAAPAFSTDSSVSYAVGSHVTYNGKLYKCTTATTGGTWVAGSWAEDTMSDPDAVLDITSQNQLRVVAKDGTLLWAQGYDLASTSSATLACDATNNFTFADGATTQAFTLPTAPTGKVGDFGLDIDNSANTGAATMTLTGLDTTFSVVVPEGESLTDMLAIAAGELAQFYITLSTFRVNDLPTWHIVKQVVENGGAAA